MKILQISYSLTSGGAERLVVDLANELAKKNEVHILTILDDNVGDNGFYKNQLIPTVNYHCAKEERGFRLSKNKRINSLVKKIAADVVHFHGGGIVKFFLPSILFNRKPKYVETLHNTAEVIFSFKRYSFITIPLIKLGFVKIITISGDNKLSLEKKCKIYDSTLIYNGRSNPLPSVLSNQVNKEIESMKKNKNDQIFIHIGRCTYQKNQQMLIQAFNDLYLKKTNFILLMFGAYFDSELGEKIKKMANPNVYFLGTKINIADYFLKADAFCLSSVFEGMPISLIEAYACECIPICTPTSGASDIIVDSRNGFISENFSKNSYLAAIERYMDNYDSFNKSVLRKTYLDFFSIERCASSYLTLYENLLKEKKYD